jgi:hypothetical protein
MIASGIYRDKFKGKRLVYELDKARDRFSGLGARSVSTFVRTLVIEI